MTVQTDPFKEADAFLAAIIRHSEDAIISKTLEGIVTSWNPAAEKIFGYTAEEMIGESITRIIPKERLDEEPEIIRRIQAGEVVEHFETTRITRDGRLVDISLTISPIKDALGRIIGASKIARDISKSKQFELKLQESVRQFQALTDAIPQMIWIRNAAGEIEYASKDWINYSGIDDVTEAWKYMVHPDDWQNIMYSWERDSVRGVPFRYEVRLRNKEGIYKWHRAVGEPVKNDNGQIIKWIGVVSDIDDQKLFSSKLEDEIAKRTRELSIAITELKQSNERFAMLFNISPVPMALSRFDDGLFVEVNPSFEKYFHISRDKMIGRTSVGAGFITSEERKQYLDKILSTENGHFTREQEQVLENGTTLYFIFSVIKFRMDDKWYLLSTYTDITALKNAEYHLKLSNIELEQKNKELESFTYISSHDLQEPLRKIQSFISVVKDKEKSRLLPQTVEYLGRISKAADRMQLLIQDLLLFSRVSTAERKFEMVQLGSVIQEVLSEWKESLEEKNASIEADVDCTLNIIPFQIKQLFNNLISNSVKFARSDGPLKIYIKSKFVTHTGISGARESACHITYADNGIGFSGEYNMKVFEVFQRLNGRNEFPGSGIGLSIVKKIIENHNGKIEAFGEPDKGVRFEMFLPVNKITL